MWTDEGVPLRAGAFLLKARELAPKNLDNRYKLALVTKRSWLCLQTLFQH